MTPDQFAARAVGVPWVRWRSDWAAMDCYGLIVLWHREVLGIDLQDVPQTDIVTGFVAAQGWQEIIAPRAGDAAWMAYRGGIPTHCGMMLTDAKVIHAAGNVGKPGSVRITPLEAMERLYGQIKFFRLQK